MMVRRRLLLLAVAGFAPPEPPWSSHGAQREDVALVVLSSSDAPAYREAAAGLRAGLGTRVTQEYLEMNGREDEAMRRMEVLRPRLVVALGSRATAAALALDAPVLSTMVMESDPGARPAEGANGRIVSRIPLDVPPRIALARLRRLFPRRRRIAVIWGPSGIRRAQADIVSEAAANGLAVRFVECESAKEMLEAVPELAGAVDLLWCLPDRVLYAPAPVQALVLASIRARLPLVGFSAGFVKAGALAGFQADYWQVGAQAADAAMRLLGGDRLKAREEPRVVRTLVNERALHIFGISLQTARTVTDMVTVK